MHHVDLGLGYQPADWPAGPGRASGCPASLGGAARIAPTPRASWRGRSAAAQHPTCPTGSNGPHGDHHGTEGGACSPRSRSAARCWRAAAGGAATPGRRRRVGHHHRGHDHHRLAPDDSLQLNQIQVIGTHNSFHEEAPAEELAALDDARRRPGRRPPLHAPGDGDPARRGEDPPDRARRLRRLEGRPVLDAGARGDHRRLRAGRPTGPRWPRPAPRSCTSRTSTTTRSAPRSWPASTEVKTWSDANPDHVPDRHQHPVQGRPADLRRAGPGRPREVDQRGHGRARRRRSRRCSSADEIITPDDVRGDHATLEEAVLDGGWPTLGESRGKVMFLMINPEPYRGIYLEGHDGLEGRILFTNAEPGQPDASYVGLDDPIADGAADHRPRRQGLPGPHPGRCRRRRGRDR